MMVNAPPEIFGISRNNLKNGAINSAITFRAMISEAKGILQ